jgi:transcription antitermination factor NusG
MNTLSNVQTLSGDISPNDVGFASSVLPQSQKMLKGVSVRYAPHPDKQWYVLRATYNREDKAYDYFIKNNTDAYLPMHYVLKYHDGKKKRVLEPLLPNFLFVYATPQLIDTYVKHTPQLTYVNYYYNHFKTENGKNPPLTIPYEDMMNFIRVSSVENEHVMVVDQAHCHYKSGDIVRVIDGDFRGVEGKVARVLGQQRVVIEIEGLCLVATAYVPSAFIKPINEK